MCVLTKNCDGKHVKLSIKPIICLYRFDLVKNHGGTKFYNFFKLVQSTLKNIINVDGKSLKIGFNMICKEEKFFLVIIIFMYSKNLI